MAAKVYWLKFGSGDPRPNTGMTPTFLQFYDSTGQTLSPPSIAEIKFGGATASGVYGFSYLIGVTTLNSIYFLAYSITTVSSGLATDQYITGVLDPVLAVDQQLTQQGVTLVAQGVTLIAQGATIVAIGNSLTSFNSGSIGSTTSSFGTTSVDPGTVFGYLKRIMENLEGDQLFTASTGVWQIYNRTGLGTTTLLRTKTLTNSGSGVTKNGL